MPEAERDGTRGSIPIPFEILKTDILSMFRGGLSVILTVIAVCRENTRQILRGFAKGD